MEIMEIIWNHSKPLTTKEIMSLIPENQWKITTVLTLISRLIDKGFLNAEKKGRNHLYSHIISKNDYRKLYTKNFLNEIHKGSIKSFFAALYSDEEICQNDLDELKAILDKRGDSNR